MALDPFGEGHWQWLQTCHGVVGPILLSSLPLLHSVGSRSENCSGLETGHGIMTFIQMAALNLLTTLPCFLFILQTEWYPCWLLICLGPLVASWGIWGLSKKKLWPQGDSSSQRACFGQCLDRRWGGGVPLTAGDLPEPGDTIQRGGRQETSQGRREPEGA